MASMLFSFAPPTVRAFAATAAKGAGGGKEEKGFLDFILGGLAKEDQFYETDPILKKVEDKNGGGGTVAGKGTVGGKKNTVAMPPKKKNGGFGGLGGLFAKE